MDENTLILYFGSMGMAGMAFAITFFAIIYQKKINHKKHELQQISDLLKATELAATTQFLEGQAREKNRIATELHDNIGSRLAILRLQLNENYKGDDIGPVNLTIDTMLSDVRQISHDLATGMYSGMNIRETLTTYLKGIEENTSLKINKLFHQLELLHDDILGKNLFNIVQELLHNTLKYAQASSVTLEINYFPDDYVNMIYHDNGTGFDPTRPHTGIGIKNMKDRVASLEGQFYISSQPDNGMEVTIEIPLNS